MERGPREFFWFGSSLRYSRNEVTDLRNGVKVAAAVKLPEILSQNTKHDKFRFEMND